MFIDLSSRRQFVRALLAPAAAALALPTLACDVREFARAHGAKLRLSIATGQVGGVYYILGGALAKIITDYVPNVEATAEVTAATVDNLKLLRAGQVDVAYVIAPSLADAYRGEGLFRVFGKVPVRALAVLYVQPMQLVTLAKANIARITDLRGRVVSVGAAGSGTEDIAMRMLQAADLDPNKDLRRELLGPAQSMDALKDGKIDAFFASNSTPTPALTELASTVGRDMQLVPLDELLPVLVRRYGEGEFTREVIAAHTYSDQDREVATVGSASLLVVDEAMSETLTYQITRILFEHRAEQAAIHPVAKTFSPQRGVAGSPVPFHPGAIKYYREVGAWPS
jgi:TRAP transporter TAXI family solute receptor